MDRNPGTMPTDQGLAGWKREDAPSDNETYFPLSIIVEFSANNWKMGRGRPVAAPGVSFRHTHENTSGEGSGLVIAGKRCNS